MTGPETPGDSLRPAAPSTDPHGPPAAVLGAPSTFRQRSTVRSVLLAPRRSGYCPWCQANHPTDPTCAAQQLLPAHLIGRAA